MPEFYIVDRSQRLSAGDVLRADNDYTGGNWYPVRDQYTNEDLEGFVRGLFPGGLSYQGKAYLLDALIVVSGASGPLHYAPTEPMVELVAELVRRLSLPEAPSRFASVFAWGTLEDCHRFKDRVGSPGAPIFAVSSDASHRHNMNLLYLGGTILGSWIFATRYWRGDAGQDPMWEHLLAPPVEVLRRVA